MALDGFSGVAVTTMITLAIVDLHVELVAGAAASGPPVGGLLREPGGKPALTRRPDAGAPPGDRSRHRRRGVRATTAAAATRSHPGVKPLRRSSRSRCSS